MKSQVDQLRKWRRRAYEQHQYETAEQIGDKILALTDNSEDAYWLAQTYYARGNYLRAAHLLTTREEHSKIPKARYLVGLSLLAAEKYDEALAIVTESVDEPERNSVELSSNHEFSSDEESEIDGGASPEALLLFLEGQAHTLQNNYDRAKAAFTRAVAADPRCYDAFSQLVSHQLLSPAEQRKLVAGLDFASLGANADLIKALYTIRMTKTSDLDAVNESLTLLNDEYDLGQNVDLMVVRSDVLLAHCRYVEGKALCDEALARDPHNYAIYPNYLTCLQELGQINKLFEVAHALARKCPDEAVSWLAVGVYYFAKGQLSDARRYFSKASIMDPYCSAAWLAFAHTFAQEGEYEQAITAYSTTARLFPGSHLPYLFLGMQHLHLNNLALASEYLLTSYSICETDPLLLNEMGVVHYNRNELDRARDHLDRALAFADSLHSDPKYWVCIRSNLGFVHRRLGNLTTALEYFSTVLCSSRADGAVLTATALVHMQLGQPDQAVVRLNQALSLSRSDPLTLDLFERAVAESTQQFSLEDFLEFERPPLPLAALEEIAVGDEMSQD